MSSTSPVTLRPYQEEAIAAVEHALRRGVQRPLIVLPTGTGKTICFATLIARRGGSALVLAHRDELLHQAAEKLAIADPTLALGVGFVAATRDDVNDPVVVGSVQTLAHARRLGGCRVTSTPSSSTKHTTRQRAPTGGSSRTWNPRR